MSRYDYFIVGAGMTADAAVQCIREVDPAGTIRLVGAEHDPPYNRPPLSICHSTKRAPVADIGYKVMTISMQ